MEIDNTGSNGKGEIDKLLQDIKEEAKIMMEDLMDIDNRIISLQGRIKSKNFTNDDLIKRLDSIRLRVGVLENEGIAEENFEKLADNLIKKLKKWVEYVI